MPGIVGLITKLPRLAAEQQLQEMLKSICYENFYRSGTWIDESLGVYVGWTVIKGSFSDGMPLYNGKGDACLIFSGEEYSEHRPIGRGRESTSGSAECSYLMTEYEQNSNFVQDLNGLFHGLIADCRRKEVTLFNDRDGMHRLCYHEAEDGFYFGSEAKAILAARPELREIDYRSFGEFASFSCVLENRTIFKGISVLPAASMWKFKNAELVSRSCYFEPREWEGQPPLAPDAYYQELRSTLTKSLPKYFSGRQQMGIAMTGGFDTRVILASHPPAPGSLPSYTFVGPVRESRDAIVGRRIASVCQQSHQLIEVGSEFLTAFPDYARRTVYISEGTVDLSRADLYLSQRAREI